MADIKRQSVAGKIATPRTGASSPAAQSSTPTSDVIDELTKSVGARIRLTTAPPHQQTYEGILTAICPVMQVLAINTRTSPHNASSSPNSQPGDFHILPTARTQSFQILSPANGTEDLKIVPIDQNRLAQRETDRIKKLKEEEQNRGKGVTAEGQAIFDSFKRINTPIRWHNQEMIVHDAVIISPPYTVEDCRGAKDKQETLNRVKKVLEGERRKLKEREERERKTAGLPGGPRKGG